jgi:hypothetical protein
MTVVYATPAGERVTLLGPAERRRGEGFMSWSWRAVVFSGPREGEVVTVRLRELDPVVVAREVS